MTKRLTKHHRVPRAANGDDSAENISWVPENKHRAYHLLFNDHPPVVVAAVLTRTWISPNWQMYAMHKEKIVQIIQHCAHKLQCDEFGVFQKWAEHHGYTHDVAVGEYEQYCEDNQMVDNTIIDFAINVLTERIKL